MSEKAIFLDRDDTIVDDPGYISEPEQVELLPGAAEAVIQFKRMGYLVVIITNQSAIARGHMDEKKLEKIHRKLKSLLSTAGAKIDGIYYCPYHPDGTVAEYAKESELRKPAPGMLTKAAAEMDIDLSQSWMVGDRYRDIEAGKAAGCHTILVDVPGKTRDLTTIGPEPDRKAVNLREAVNIIRMYEFHQKAQTARKSQTTEDEETESIAEPEPEETIKAPPPEPEEDTLPAIEEPVVQPESAEVIKEETPPEQEETESEDPAPRNESQTPPLKFHTARPVRQPEVPTHDEPSEHTHQILHEILQRLRSSGRTELYDDFSIHKLIAGMAQVLAIGSIVFSLVLWLSPKVGSQAVLIMIGYAIALQLLVIALLLMHRRD